MERKIALLPGEICTEREKITRKPTCESRLNVQKSADAIVRKLLQQLAEGLNMK
jgi:hypothetical protein